MHFSRMLPEMLGGSIDSNKPDNHLLLRQGVLKVEGGKRQGTRIRPSFPIVFEETQKGNLQFSLSAQLQRRRHSSLCQGEKGKTAGERR